MDGSEFSGYGSEIENDQTTYSNGACMRILTMMVTLM